MNQEKIRNVAIIAHVDHGKTTLVDQLFKFTGTFEEHQDVEERLMDSIDLEKERGITIKAKNAACHYNDYLVNIIDTPGHADFGGEVERVLKMADGAVFLVDAQEGPMPQSYFVLKKAVALDLPVIVVINKIDKPSARCDWVLDQVFDMLVGLQAPDHILDFTTIYASAKNGISSLELDNPKESMEDIFETIIKDVPAPKGASDQPFQLLVSDIDYSNFLGRLAIGKVAQGSVKVNQDVIVTDNNEELAKARITKIYEFQANEKVEIPEASVGQIIVVSGLSDVKVAQTISDPSLTESLAAVPIDPPTISMHFMANNSPFAGKEGEFVTASQLKERLQREMLTDLALTVEELSSEAGYLVAGRGELHLSILIEKLIREGYEFQVSKPKVILKEENGKKQEPYENLSVEVSEDYMGAVIERLGERKGNCVEMQQEHGQCYMTYRIPTRGLLGFFSEFLTITKGLGVMSYRFDSYDTYVGEIKTRKNGVMISNQAGDTVAFALFNLQDRGILFMGPGEPVYEGQIIGEHCREDDIVVNQCKGKKLSNVRSSSSDEAIVLTPHKELTLEYCLSYIDDTELLECTPKNIRIRKKFRTEGERKRNKQA